MNFEAFALARLVNTFTSVHAEADLERFRAQERKESINATLLGILFFFVLITGKLFDAIRHFQAHDWWNLARDILSSLLDTFFPLIGLQTVFALLKGLRGDSSLAAKVLELRWRLNDEMIAPPTALQPLPLEAEELPFAPTRIGPVRRVKKQSFILFGTSIFLFFINVLLGAILIALLPWIRIAEPADPALWGALALGIALLFLSTFTIFEFVLAIRYSRTGRVVVDESRIHWQRSSMFKKRSFALIWPEITGLYEITCPEGKGLPLKTYVLDSATSTFTWSLNEGSTQKEQQASIYLTRLITTRTGLLLRDLTRAVEPLLRLPSETSEVKEVLISDPQKSIDS